MNPKSLIPLVAGLGIAGLGAKLGLDYVKKAQGSTSKVVKLWTPIQDIPRGVAITEAMIAPLNFPQDAAPKTAIVDKAKLLGRVPHTGAPAGVPILDSMLLSAGSRPGIHVPDGFRAVAVKIDESSGVDYHLAPGVSVDVVGFFTVKRSGKSEVIARTLIDNVEVAAVGDQIALSTPQETSDAKNGKSSKTRSEKARAVTLFVKPDQAPLLHLAEQRGKIKLSLRGNSIAQDDEDYEPPTSTNINEDDVLGESKKNEAGELAGLVKGIFDSFTKKEEPAAAAPTPAETAPPPEPPPPPIAWVMTVYNGEDRVVLGWHPNHLFEPVELAGTDSPNIFEQERRRTTNKPPGHPPMKNPPAQNLPPTDDPGQSNVSGDQPDDDNTDVSEPEELFE